MSGQDGNGATGGGRARKNGMSRRCFAELSVSAAAACSLLAGGAQAGVPRGVVREIPPMPEKPGRRESQFRRRMCINADWRFALGDHIPAGRPDYDDGRWQTIGLPHSFSLPYFRGTEFYVGVGWYRRVIDIPVDWKEKKISLEFEAAFQQAEVYVNGVAVGAHTGGFTEFEIDISGVARTGKNILAVRVNNVWNPEVAPRAGDHIFDGGLYRNVWLCATDALHIAYQGIRISTPEVSPESATVKVETRVTNAGTAAQKCTVVHNIINPQGESIAEIRNTQEIGPGGERNFIDRLRMQRPLLWHPDHPYLYRVRTTVLGNGGPVDQEYSPLGLRWFRWTAERGFFLNGKHLWIHGGNVHQDHAGWASGATDAGAWRDVRMVKEAGFNFIRTSHYPHSRAFMEACDYYGILVWSEMCFWGVGGFGPDGNWRASAYPVEESHRAGFEKSCLQQLGEMIGMHRNHPCIIAWSMCNEVFFTDFKVFGRMKNLLRTMVRRTHRLDPSRPAGIGGAQRGGVDRLGDVAGYNGDGATLYINPGFPNLVTEYGSVAAIRPGPYRNDFGSLQTTKFAWRGGISIWCAFDYGTWVGITGEMGIVDYYRLPKRAWHWYREHNRRIAPPVWPQSGRAARLHAAVDREVIHGTDAIEDSHVIVRVLDKQGRPVSNSPSVTLRIESGPGEFPTGREITFRPDADICIRDGAAAIEFRSYHAGESIIRATSPGLEPMTLRITTTGEPVYIPGVTPETADRPYVRAPQPNQNTYRTRESRRIDMAINRPTTASSSRNGHSSRLANDGNPLTYWQAANNERGQWCQVDLEGDYSITDVNAAFPGLGRYVFQIMVSTNGHHWQRVAQGRVDNHKFNPPVKGRYVRIVLLDIPPGDVCGISEIQVFGHHLV